MTAPSVAFVPLQVSVTVAEVLGAAARIGGLAVLSAAIAGTVAIAYRWYARERVPPAPTILLGVAAVAAYVNATTALGQVMGGEAVLSLRVAAFNVSALAAGVVAAALGTVLGDRLARTVLGGTEPGTVDASLGRVVRAVGRVITVELPADIADVAGYDPVDPETKSTLEGKTFVFPKGLTVAELRDRLVTRLREDYRVGHVDLEIDEDGTVTHLGVGSRAAGIGPTLPPESAAVAIRADPAHAASSGDLVQVWSRDPQQRLFNAEVRGTAGEVVTLAIDAADATKIDPEARYKLVTLPVEERADRELTELLRAADETLGVVEVDPDSALVGVPIGALDLTVVAVHAGGPDDRVEALPERERVLSAGDSVYVVARPEAIRRLESAAEPSAGTGEHATSVVSPVDSAIERPVDGTSDDAPPTASDPDGGSGADGPSDPEPETGPSVEDSSDIAPERDGVEERTDTPSEAEETTDTPSEAEKTSDTLSEAEETTHAPSESELEDEETSDTLSEWGPTEGDLLESDDDDASGFDEPTDATADGSDETEHPPDENDEAESGDGTESASDFDGDVDRERD